MDLYEASVPRCPQVAHLHLRVGGDLGELAGQTPATWAGQGGHLLPGAQQAVKVGARAQVSELEECPRGSEAATPPGGHSPWAALVAAGCRFGVRSWGPKLRL